MRASVGAATGIRRTPILIAVAVAIALESRPRRIAARTVIPTTVAGKRRRPGAAVLKTSRSRRRGSTIAAVAIDAGFQLLELGTQIVDLRLKALRTARAAVAVATIGIAAVALNRRLKAATIAIARTIVIGGCKARKPAQQTSGQ